MADGQVNFFLDSLDDPLLPDGVPSFDGGQFSNWRANLLKPNQSKQLTNCDIDKLGKLRTRRGTIRVGTGTAGTGTLIQGLTSYQTKDFNYIVAANGGLIWSFNGTTWDQIARGGTVDNEEILIQRSGKINKPAVVGPPAMPEGYTFGDTVLAVDGITGVVGNGEKLYFMNNIRTEYFEYTIAAHVETGANTTEITLEEPGLVFEVKDNWDFVVMRPALVNNAAGYPSGATAIAIDGYVGTPNVGEKFVIKSENITHTIGAGSTATLLNFTPPLQTDWAAADATVPIVFAQGNDQLFFCDGVNEIFAWNGKTLMNLGSRSILDELTQSVQTMARTIPPKGVKVLLWFQNRLIASAISTEPDTIYFSDFFNPTAWDKDYQSLRVGGGESDPITGLTAWTDLNMLVFKKNSIYVINLDPLQNPTPDDPTLLVASFAVKQIHKRMGCPAPWTAVQVGGGSSQPGSDVFFVDGDKKVRSIRRVLAAETQQEVGDAVSLPVQDVLDQINITWITRAVAFYHNDHYILAFPKGGEIRPNAVVVYNLLTQTWCGEWTGWWPTAFAMRTDLGDYSKLIFGQWDGTTSAGSLAGVGGTVCQWMDDLSLQEETDATYQDNVVAGVGVVIPTKLHTRAITFGDPFSFKTGLNVEFEFDESMTAKLTVQVILDKVPHASLIARPFTTLSAPQQTIPITIPFTLGDSPGLLRYAFDLQRYGTWRELQFMMSTTQDKLSMRSIRVTGFTDTLQLQTVPPLLPPLVTTYSLAGPTTGVVGIPVTFSVELAGGVVDEPITVIPSDIGGGGTFSPITVILTGAARYATFTYTAGSVGTKTIMVTNNGGLINPPNIIFIATLSTSYLLSGPSSGVISVPSSAFIVELPAGGSVSGTVTVTPNDSSGGGTFTPTTVALTTGAPLATFTYTPNSVGPKTIGVTNSGGLTDPGSLAYEVSSVLVQHLLDTLISYWKLDEISGRGPVARSDSSGANHLTDNANSESTTGKIDNGVLLVASSGKNLSCASNTSLQVTGDFTFSVWIKMNTIANNQVALSKDFGTAGSRDYSLDAYASAGLGGFRFWVAGDTANQASSAATIAAGAWTHVVAWFDSALNKVFIRINDAATTSGASTTGPLIQSAAPFTIGARTNLSDPGFCDCVMDEVVFWKRKLTAAEITSLYNSGAGLPFSGFLP
jgi:hypothetical protein